RLPVADLVIVEQRDPPAPLELRDDLTRTVGRKVVEDVDVVDLVEQMSNRVADDVGLVLDEHHSGDAHPSRRPGKGGGVRHIARILGIRSPGVESPPPCSWHVPGAASPSWYCRKPDSAPTRVRLRPCQPRH